MQSTTWNNCALSQFPGSIGLHLAFKVAFRLIDFVLQSSFSGKRGVNAAVVVDTDVLLEETRISSHVGN
jgi:hypothetical protein